MRFIPILLLALAAPAFAQDKPSSSAPSADQVKQLRDELLTLIAANDRRYVDLLAAQKQISDIRFEGQKDATAFALAAADRAVSKSEEAVTKRFDAANETKAAMSRQQDLFASKDKVDMLEKQLSEQKAVIEKLQAASSGVLQGGGYVIGALGFVAGLVGAIVAIMAMRKKPALSS